MVMYSFHPTHFILAYHHENVNHGEGEKEATDNHLLHIFANQT